MSPGLKIFLGFILFIFLLCFLQGWSRMPEFNARKNRERAKADHQTINQLIINYNMSNNELPKEVNITDEKNKRIEKAFNNLYITTHDLENAENITDPFSVKKDLPYAYYQDQKRFILISPGPDKKYQISKELFLEMTGPEPDSGNNANILNKTYDPTNGTFSPGDIYLYHEIENTTATE